MNREIDQPRFAVNVGFECLRGLSALWVFLFHIAGSLEHLSPLVFSIAKFGYLGVPIFFAISGYCIYASAEDTLRKGQHPNNFLLRRLIRVMPPFWASILLIAALPYFMEALSSIKSGVYTAPSPRWLQFSIVDWVKIASLTQVFFNEGGDLQEAFSPINAVYWSLAIEIQLYIVIYLVSFFRSGRKKILILLSIVSVISTTIPAIRDSGLFFSFWPAFFSGILLKWTHDKGITPNLVFGKKSLEASSIGALLLLFFAGSLIFHSDYISRTFSLEEYNLTFTLVAIFSAFFMWLLAEIEYFFSRSRTVKIKKSSLGMSLLLPICLIGQSSYSLYLMHGQLQRLPAMLLKQIISPDSALFPLITVTATVFLCYFFYKIVEVPFLKIGKIIAKSDTALRIPNKSVNAV